MPRLAVYAGKWPKVRLAILARDGYQCQIKLPGCTGRATAVDHIIPVLSGGAWWDESNLRATCVSCNNHRKTANGSRRWQSAITYITVVTGESTLTSRYVTTHSQSSDLIVDHTRLLQSTHDERQAITLRQRLIEDLRQGRIQKPRAWITCSPDEASRLPQHRRVDLGGAMSGIGEGHRRPNDVVATSAPSRAW